VLGNHANPLSTREKFLPESTSVWRMRDVCVWCRSSPIIHTRVSTERSGRWNVIDSDRCHSNPEPLTLTAGFSGNDRQESRVHRRLMLPCQVGRIVSLHNHAISEACWILMMEKVWTAPTCNFIPHYLGSRISSRDSRPGLSPRCQVLKMAITMQIFLMLHAVPQRCGFALACSCSSRNTRHASQHLLEHP
jgi:hypothetical protein